MWFVTKRMEEFYAKQAGQYIILPGNSVGSSTGKDILMQPIQIAFQGREGEEVFNNLLLQLNRIRITLQ